MTARASTALARAVLAYLALMIAVITLAPFRFATAPVQGITAVVGLRDVVLNLVLFFPLGFVERLGRGRDEGTGWARAFGLGFALSLVIELAQLFAPGRYPSVADLFANATGAALGALACARAVRRVDGPRTVRALALELPLVGLTFLLVPMLWAATLAQVVPTELLLLPVASAAWVFGSVHAAYAPPSHGSDEGPLRRMGLGALLWTTVALAPAALTGPWVLVAAVFVLIATLSARFRAPAALVAMRAADGAPSRRFEGPTLRIALVPLVTFVVTNALWPIAGWRETWEGMLALMPPGTALDDRTAYATLAQLAGFTAVGYAIAEYGGRRIERAREVVPRGALVGGALALALEVVQGFLAGHHASVLRLVLGTAAAAIGAGLYVLQLRQIRSLLGRGTGR